MADILNSSGLQVKTLSEIISELESNFKAIYGNDINLDQNSPDGQMLNIYAQAAVDLRELLVALNNSFDPDRAVGTLLDQRAAINNIERRAGTFTITPIELVVDRTVTLQGLDADFNNVDGTGYTVQDDSGNEFILIDTATLTAGTHTKNFRAKNIGRVETTTGTITSQKTVVLGVTSVNNPSAATEIGQDEETDGELRIRRRQSVAIASNGYLNGLLAAVLNLDGVTDARLYENVTNSTDSDGIPAHGIWLIVEGGANTDIANQIYSKKSFGANMKGDVDVDVDITTASGSTFTAKFDRPTAEDLYIQFDIQPTVTGASFNQAAIKSYIAENISYNIGQFAETSSITAVALAAIQATSGNVGVPVNVEISDDDATWVDYLETSAKDNQFVIDTANITITEL